MVVAELNIMVDRLLFNNSKLTLSEPDPQVGEG